jgi:O-antigen ligase
MNNNRIVSRTTAALLVLALCLASGYAIGTSAGLPLLACLALVWLPVVFLAAQRRPMTVLMVWLLASPVVANLIERPGMNPFFVSRAEREQLQEWRGGLTREQLERYHAGANRPVEVFDIVTIDRLAVFFFLLLALRKRKVPFDLPEKFMIGFSLWVLMSVALFTRNPNFGLTVTAGAWVLPFLAYFAARRLFDSENRLLAFQRALTYLGVFIIALAFVERAVYADYLMYRVSGVFKSSSLLGLVLLTVFFSTLSLRLSQGRINFSGKLVLWLSPVVILLTLSRGLWVALLFGLMLFLYQGRSYLPRYVNVLLAGLLAISMAFGIIGMTAAQGTEFGQTRVFNVETMLSRFVVERATIALAMESPIVGIGLNNLRNEIYRITSLERGWLGLRLSHNSTLSIWAELGIVGILLLAGVYLSLLKRFRRMKREADSPGQAWNGIAWISILGGYILSSMFANTLYLGMLAPILFFMYARVLRGVYRPAPAGAYAAYPAVAGPRPAARLLHPRLAAARFGNHRSLIGTGPRRGL